MTAARRQSNVSDCRNGVGLCDHSKLTLSETNEVTAYAKLTPAEAKMLADAEHKRNYAACLNGYDYCDLTRLTAEETHSIQPKDR